MAQTPVQIQDLTDTLATASLDRVLTSLISVPNTAIVNRAQIPDLANDLGVRMGINRIPVQQIYEIPTEQGPNGEPVWGEINDTVGRLRFVGNWVNFAGTSGMYVRTATQNDTVEITFYGTGLQIGVYLDNAAWDVRATVDGGAEGANFFPGTSTSTILSARNYNGNNTLNVVSGLTLGYHTVRLRNAAAAAGIYLQFIQILNESSQLAVSPGTYLRGGRRVSLSTLQNLAFDSSFESGSVTADGGRVLVYLKPDGTIGKSATPVGTQLNLTAANHTNEEIIQTLHPREFGAGRSDDFSTLTSSSSTRTFTLEDGTTCLQSNGCALADTPNGVYTTAGTTNRLTLTFVGTGLDVLTQNLNTGSTVQYNVTVDGSAIGNYSLGTQPQAARVVKIVSGLPYGTHTVTFTNNSGAVNGPGIVRFLVYGPRKPALPAGATELAEYFTVASYTPNTTAGATTIARGVIRRQITQREAVYVNGTGGTTDWTIAIDGAAPSGFTTYTDRQNAYVEATFWGEAFEFRFNGASDGTSTATLSLNGNTLNTTNFRINGTGTPTFGDITTSFYGGGSVSFNATTGVLTMTQASGQQGCGFRVSGLARSRYTFRATQSATVAPRFLYASALDVVTPIHSPRVNGPFVLQNALRVGNQGINDLRVLPLPSVLDKRVKQGGFAQSFNALSYSGTTAWLPVPGLQQVVECAGNTTLELDGTLSVFNNTQANGTYLSIWVDGAPTGPEFIGHASSGGGAGNLRLTFHIKQRLRLSRGQHLIEVRWAADSGSTLTVAGTKSGTLFIGEA